MKAIGVILTSDVGATGQSPLRLTKIGACAGAHVLAFAKVGAHSCAPLQLKRGTGGMSEDGKAKLPKGWVWATVGQLSDETRAVTYGVIKLGEPVENGIPTLRSSNVRHLRLDLNGLKRISPAIADNYKRTFLKGGEVLVTVRGTLGGVIVAPSTCAGYNISREVARIALIDNSFGAIVALFIASPSIQRWLNANTKGIAYTGINIETLREMPIPLPPRPEQHRIVEEIEKQFTRLDAAVAALERARANLKRYRASVLKAACEGRLVPAGQEEASFRIECWQTIASALVSLDQGWSPKCDNQPANEPEEWGVIKTSAVQALEYNEWENKRLPAPLGARPALELRTGDLLVTRAGPRKRVGVCCLVRSTRPHLMLCDKVYRLRCNNEVIRPGYLELVLNTPQITDAINKLKTGISDSGVNLTQRQFEALKIPLPSLELQAKIESEVERLWSISAATSSVVAANLKRAERLRQSILKRAFEGKLVPQDPKDEPASVLLERIRAERQVEQKATAKAISKPSQKSKRPQGAETQAELFR